MIPLSPLDYLMLLTETPESPRHVAGVMVFEPPEGEDKSFPRTLVEKFRATAAVAPFNYTLSRALLALPVWEIEKNVDMEHHVRHLAVPRPGTMTQLMELVAEIHEPLLDRNRPLWEFYVIEGLEGGRFALYSKIHHAYADGATMTRWMDKSLNRTPDSKTVRPVWTCSAASPRGGRATDLGTLVDDFRKMLGGGLLSAAELYTLLLKHVLKAVNLDGNGLPVPFSAPRTLLNQRLGRRRSAGIAAIGLDRIKKVGKATGTTVNDVILAICDMALTSYLESHDKMPDKPLVAEMPVDLRDGDHTGGGNVVSILLVELARGKLEPLRRLLDISKSAKVVKREFSAVTGNAVTAYTIIVQSIAQLGDILGVSDQLPPLGNLVISNLPGPRDPLYLAGAELTEMYPISTVAPGTVMNITVFSYSGTVFFGLIAGEAAIEDLPGLTANINRGFEELEAAALKKAGGGGKKRAKG